MNRYQKEKARQLTELICFYLLTGVFAAMLYYVISGGW